MNSIHFVLVQEDNVTNNLPGKLKPFHIYLFILIKHLKTVIERYYNTPCNLCPIKRHKGIHNTKTKFILKFANSSKIAHLQRQYV